MGQVLEMVGDTEIAEINQWHYRASVGSILAAWECGKRLVKKKAEINERWIPWVERNLDFGESTARRYMQLWRENQALTPDLKPSDAVELLCKLWSNNTPVRGTGGTGDNEWFTPSKYIELARRVLGGIDLDPASHEDAQRFVMAKNFFTKEDDGLKRQWNGRVWLNPPYAQPLIGQFIEKLLEELEADRVSSAIALTHNYTDTAWFQKGAEIASAICFTRGRIAFLDINGNEAAPTQGQAFFYYGDNVEMFSKIFVDVGFVVRP